MTATPLVIWLYACVRHKRKLLGIFLSIRYETSPPVELWRANSFGAFGAIFTFTIHIIIILISRNLICFTLNINGERKFR